MNTAEKIAAAQAELEELKKQQRIEEAAARRAVIEASVTKPGEEIKWLDRSARIEGNGYRVHVMLAKNSWDRDETKKVRVNVSGEVDVDFTEAYEMQKANGYQPKGVNPAEDKLFAKLNRQVVANKRDVVEAAVVAVPWLGELLDDVKLHFSRTAGCSCGCSPAFIGSRHIYLSVDGRTRNVTDIWVEKLEVEA